MEITFQLAKTTDIDILIAFTEDFYQLEQIAFDPHITRTALSTLLSQQSLGLVWLIQKSGQAIGYVVICFYYSLEYGGLTAFVDELYIQDQYRGQGIGKRTLIFLEDYCQSLQIKALHLEVNHHNPIARSLYQQAGFKINNREMMTKPIEQKKDCQVRKDANL